ncbi:response regulator transcription factor [Pseudomonas putida]|nr:response regulator transcription factor [Pseudomonas putida]
MTIQVLVATADRALATKVMEHLGNAGMSCDYGHDARMTLALACDTEYDVILIDSGLPGPDGLYACRRLREFGLSIPVLMISGPCLLQDKLAAFEAGTDDYLCIPCDLKELQARLVALSQRRSGQTRCLVAGELRLHLDSRQAWRGDQMLNLSPTAWKLLEALVRAAPSAVSRERLERLVWGDERPDGNTLNVHIHNLRKAIGKEDDTRLIHTMRGAGFRLIISEPGV